MDRYSYTYRRSCAIVRKAGARCFQSISEWERQPTMPDPSTSRRGFLNYLTSLVLAVIGLLMLVPTVRYFLAPLWRTHVGEGGQPDFADVCKVADLPIGEWRLLSLEMVHEDGWRKSKVRHAIWVRRQREGDKDITVLSSICPHLGCPVNWQPEQSRFFCPCHGGLFDVTGKQTGGPPPRAMDPLDWEVRSGRLFVRWQDFKIGVEKRIVVNV